MGHRLSTTMSYLKSKIKVFFKKQLPIFVKSDLAHKPEFMSFLEKSEIPFHTLDPCAHKTTASSRRVVSSLKSSIALLWAQIMSPLQGDIPNPLTLPNKAATAMHSQCNPAAHTGWSHLWPASFLVSLVNLQTLGSYGSLSPSPASG